MIKAIVVALGAALALAPVDGSAQIGTTRSYSFPQNTVYADTVLTGLGASSLNNPKYVVTLNIQQVLIRCVNKAGNAYFSNGQPFRLDVALAEEQTGATMIVRNGRALSAIEFSSEDLIEAVTTAYLAQYGTAACKKNWYANEVIVTVDELWGRLFECTDSTYSTCVPWDALDVQARLLTPFGPASAGVLPPPTSDTCATTEEALTRACNYHLKVSCSDSRKIFTDLEVKPSCDQVPYCSACACTTGSTQPCKY
jgi:hypothetical protein